MSLWGFVVLDVSLQFLPPATIWLRNFQFSGLSVKNLLCTTLIVLLFHIILESVCIFSIGNWRLLKPVLGFTFFFFLCNLHSLGRHRKRNLVWLPSNLWVSSTLTSLLLIISHNQMPAFRSYQMEETFDKLMKNQDSVLKNRDITLLTNVHIVKAVVFPVVMYRCESWIIKKAEHWRIDAFELWCWRRLLSPLDCKEIKSVNPKGNKPWIFIRRTDAEAEAPILWPVDVKNQLIGKDPDVGKDWRQKKKGAAEDEIVR